MILTFGATYCDFVTSVLHNRGYKTMVAVGLLAFPLDVWTTCYFS